MYNKKDVYAPDRVLANGYRKVKKGGVIKWSKNSYQRDELGSFKILYYSMHFAL